MAEYKISYDMNFSDMFCFAISRLWVNKPGRVVRNWFNLLFLSAIATVPFSVPAHPKASMDLLIRVLLYMAIALVVMVTVFGVVAGWLSMAALKKSFRKQNVTMTLLLNQNALRSYGKANAEYRDYVWSSISGWDESWRGFMVFFDRDRAKPYFFLPKRAMKEGASVTGVRRLLEEKIGPRGHFKLVEAKPA